MKIGGKNTMDTFLQSLIAYAYQKIGNQRSARSFYFILKGKRSLQASQDAQLFGLEGFYSTLPMLDYDKYEVCYKSINDRTFPALEIEKAWYYKQLHNYETSLKARYFIERLQLLVQLLSHIKRKDKRYMPMCRRYETQKYIKQLFKQKSFHTKFPRVDVDLFNEYYTLLCQMPEVNREIMMGLQVGYGFYGETAYQISERLGLSQTEVWMNMHAAMLFLYQEVRKEPKRYPLLTTLLPAMDSATNYTLSARKTREWLDKGKTIEEICEIRHMKRGTIESHIIEIAMYDQAFPIEMYMTEKKLEQIMDCSRQRKSFRLRELKEVLGEDFSYFEIRLGLTKVEE